MNSVYALKLSRAVKNSKLGGDFIDHGWSIIKELHKEGFDIITKDEFFAGAQRGKTLNEMCGLNHEPK